MKIYSVALALTLAAVLACGCVVAQAASTDQAAGSGIKGKVMVDGKDAAPGVYVYAYDSPYNDLRVPTKLISAPTDKDGSYSLSLAPGTYYVVARKRLSGSQAGPLAEGDFEGRYASNPVVVNSGEFAAVNLSVNELTGQFLLSPYAHMKKDMGISGKVIGEDGKPVSGAYVMLYDHRERIGKPTYLSTPTDQNGEYAVYPSKPGTYYVAARAKYGDLPQKGEPYGTYDKDPEHKVEVKEKTVTTGIDLTMTRFTRDLTRCAEH